MALELSYDNNINLLESYQQDQDYDGGLYWANDDINCTNIYSDQGQGQDQNEQVRIQDSMQEQQECCFDEIMPENQQNDFYLQDQDQNHYHQQMPNVYMDDKNQNYQDQQQQQIPIYSAPAPNYFNGMDTRVLDFVIPSEYAPRTAKGNLKRKNYIKKNHHQQSSGASSCGYKKYKESDIPSLSKEEADAIGIKRKRGRPTREQSLEWVARKAYIDQINMQKQQELLELQLQVQNQPFIHDGGDNYTLDQQQQQQHQDQPQTMEQISVQSLALPNDQENCSDNGQIYEQHQQQPFVEQQPQTQSMIMDIIPSQPILSTTLNGLRIEQKIIQRYHDLAQFMLRIENCQNHIHEQLKEAKDLISKTTTLTTTTTTDAMTTKLSSSYASSISSTDTVMVVDDDDNQRYHCEEESQQKIIQENDKTEPKQIMNDYCDDNHRKQKTLTQLKPKNIKKKNTTTTNMKFTQTTIINMFHHAIAKTPKNNTKLPV